MNSRTWPRSLKWGLLATLLLAACSAGGEDDGSANAASCMTTGNGVNTLSIGAANYREGAGGPKLGPGGRIVCDPLINGYSSGGIALAYIMQGMSPAGSQQGLAIAFVAMGLGTYSVPSDASVAYLSGNDVSRCHASAGTVTVTAMGAVGGRIVGSYTVPAGSFSQAGQGTCPAGTFSGSFDVTRVDPNAPMPLSPAN